MFEDLKQYWEAFLMLHHYRPCNGFGITAIPVSEIKAYLDLREMSLSRKLEFFEMITLIDKEYLRRVRDKKN